MAAPVSVAGAAAAALPPPQPVAIEAAALPAPASIVGFVNYSLQEQVEIHRWEEIVRDVYERFGFTPLKTRQFERRAHLEHAGGVGKQIFGVTRFDGEQETEYGLPFDHTLPLALYVAQNHHAIPFPYKRYDCGTVFRGEKAQPGRFRGFTQCDVDIVGRNLNISADVECIAAITEALRELSVGKFTVYLNHIGIVRGIIAYYGIPEEKQAAVLRLIDKMDKMSKVDVVASIMDVVPAADSKRITAMVNSFDFHGKVTDWQCVPEYGEKAQACFADLKQAFAELEASGVSIENFSFAPGMVRGLDYYTGIVFETFLDGKEQFGSISSGGRFDDLVGKFNESAGGLEGAGGAIGLTRLFDVMTRTKSLKLHRTTTADLLVGYRTEEQKQFALGVAGWLRQQGAKVDLWSGKVDMKKQLKFADKSGIPFAILAMNHDEYVVKDLRVGEHGASVQTQFKTGDEAGAFALKSLRA